MSRMKSAIPLNEYEDRVSGFGAREDREARRDERRKRRRDRKEGRRERRDERKGGRKERKAERRIDRVQRKKEKVREKLVSAPGSVAVPSSEPRLMPAPTEPPKKKKWVERVTEFVDDFLEEDGAEDEELEELEDEEEEPRQRVATEGIGAFPNPFRTAPQPEAWGPAVRMGNRLKIQAAQGFRAAVIELKPGLFLVAEMPEAVTRTEFGLAPFLAPLMTAAARRSLDEPAPQRRGLFRDLFRRRDVPIRYVTVQPPAALPGPAPLALPGPVEQQPEPMVVAAPNVGWADDATVAAAYGCDRCEKEPR